MRAQGPGPGIRDARSHGPSDGAFGSVRHAAHGYPYAWQRMGIYGIRGGRDRASVVGQGDSTDLPGTHTDTYPTPSFWSAPNPTPRPDSHTAPAALISHCSQAPALCHWPPSGHPPPLSYYRSASLSPNRLLAGTSSGFSPGVAELPEAILGSQEGALLCFDDCDFPKEKQPKYIQSEIASNLLRGKSCPHALMEGVPLFHIQSLERA